LCYRRLEDASPGRAKNLDIKKDQVDPNSNDGSLGDVGGGDWYLVVPLDEVDLAEDSAAVQAVGQVLHVWEWVPVRGVDGVEVCCPIKLFSSRLLYF
jgi:hypothetical protein